MKTAIFSTMLLLLLIGTTAQTIYDDCSVYGNCQTTDNLVSISSLNVSGDFMFRNGTNSELVVNFTDPTQNTQTYSNEFRAYKIVGGLPIQTNYGIDSFETTAITPYVFSNFWGTGYEYTSDGIDPYLLMGVYEDNITINTTVISDFTANFSSVYASNVCYSDGTNCTGGGGGNPFDQWLNISSNVTFNNASLTGHLSVNQTGYFKQGASAYGNTDPNWGGIKRGFAVGGVLGSNIIPTTGSFYALSSEATMAVNGNAPAIAGYNSGMVTGTGSGDITDFLGMYGFLIPTSLLGYSGEITNAIAMKGAMSDFGGNVARNAKGAYVLVDAGNVTTYGYHIGNLGGKSTTERRGFIDTDNHADAHSSLKRDDKYWLWGADEDFGIGFNGTRAIYNSSRTGTSYDHFFTDSVAVESLQGSYTGGSAYVCVYDNGTLYTNETGCV